MAMPVTRFMAAALCTVLIALCSCSKTQDTAPETRVFGDPPAIQSVSVVTNPNAVASCDYSDEFLASRDLCPFSPMLLGPLMVESTYTEVAFQVNVTDPDDPPPPATETDVLLVAASYVTGSGGAVGQEDSFVLFDDGSQTPFSVGQQDGRPGDCFFDTVNKRCDCSFTDYNVTSNDPTAGDNTFTRNFAFAPGGMLPDNMSGLYLDCIARGKQQAASIAADIGGQTFDFRIEAVDRSGNLTEWPNRPSATIGTGSISCSGDPCACCLMLNTVNPGRPQSEGGCRDLDGLMFEPSMTNPYGFFCPNGYCKSTSCLPP